jgi:two-component SAPR family response regulator
MRVGMNRLRALLIQQVPAVKAEVVRSDRDGVCRLDTRVVWSDAHEFVRLCRQARHATADGAIDAYERALELYRGDLLDGHGARFYDWVHDRGDGAVSLREQFRNEYEAASRRLALLHLEHGRPERAAELLRGLLRAEPTLEEIVRDLYRCYRKTGDLNGLIREDRQLRQALWDAFHDPNVPDDDPAQYQPDPETVALFDEVRAELTARRREPQAVA